jgi:gamma-glutamylcyclotransferase (GGCT)/AIG2-like uncharacterized protein YtfP
MTPTTKVNPWEARGMREPDNPEERLIVYGTLAPGERYHFLLADLEGGWEECVIRGRLGEYRGFPVFKYDEEGPEHRAWLFTSRALPGKFPELDEFEGASYLRAVIPARVGKRRVLANIYEGRESA